MSKPTLKELLAKAKEECGFLVEEDVRLLVEYDPGRKCLIRFGADRTLVRADEVEATIKRVTANDEDYVRDVSLPTTDPVWNDDPIIGRNKR